MVPLPSSATAAEICLFDLDDLGAVSFSLRHCADLLPAEELRRSKEARTEAERSRFLVSRIALRRLIERQVGGQAVCSAFSRRQGGKPHLAGGPEFSVAHCEGAAIAAVSGNDRVGVDIESARGIELPPDWSRRYPLLAMLAEACQAAGFAGEAAFLHAWVRLEAMAKLDGRPLPQWLDRRPPFGALPPVASWDVHDGKAAAFAGREGAAPAWLRITWSESGPEFLSSVPPDPSLAGAANHRDAANSWHWLMR